LEHSVFSIFIGSVNRRCNQDEIVGVYIGEKVGLKKPEPIGRRGGGKGGGGQGRIEKRAGQGKDPKWRPE